MEDSRLSVKIAIADRKYPLKIARQNEEQLRKAARLINEKLDEYNKDYPDKDIQDKLAISTLQFVLKLLDTEENKSLLSLQTDLRGLDGELESYLNKQTGSLQ